MLLHGAYPLTPEHLKRVTALTGEAPTVPGNAAGIAAHCPAQIVGVTLVVAHSDKH